MKKRVVTAFFLGLVLFPAVFFGGIFFLIVSLFCAYVGTYELMNMFYKKDESLKAMRFVTPVFSIVLVLLFYFFTNSMNAYLFSINNASIAITLDTSFNTNSIALYGLLIFLVYLLFVISIMIANIFIKNSSAHSVMSTILSFTYAGLLLGAAFSMEYVKPIQTDRTTFWGGQVFGYLYLVVVFTDMFAFFVGRKIGKHKLCPTISPNKSVEGAIGGLIFGSIFGTLFAFLFGVMPIEKESNALTTITTILITLLISIVISIVVQIGDLVASKLKRSYEIKDYGFIFPGHGGVMDRFDSLILSGSFVYVIVMIIKIICIGVL